MINIAKDIHSLTDFKRNTTEYVKQIKESKRPFVLTVNGSAELVVQDAEGYQALLDAVERAESISGIRRGLDQMFAGEGQPAEEAFNRFRRKFNIPNG